MYTYEIDEAERRVYALWHGVRVHGYWMSFGTIGVLRPTDALSNDEKGERLLAYRVARDELVERGLIRE